MLDEIKKEERKAYKKYVFFIVIGIVLAAIGFKLNGWYADALVILGGIIVILFLQIIANTFDIYYKIKGKLKEEETGEPFKETYIEWPVWVQKFGGIIYMLVIGVGFSLFGAMHENDFGGLRFVWHSLLFGLLAGFAINTILKLRFTSWSSNRNKSYEIAFYLIVSSIFISVCFSPIVNKYYSKGDLRCNSYQILSYDKNYKTGAKYIHVLTKNGTEERFSPSRAFFDRLSDDHSTVILCTRKGFLGYEYVEEFRLPE
jgi:hypothetical protein